MEFWRISRHRDLEGKGGLRASGRWSEMGLRVVYLATSPAGALLESLAHTAAGDAPPGYTLLKVVGPEQAEVVHLNPEELPEDWRRQILATQRLGSQWLQEMRTPLLRVPSALAPETWNYLLNPEHAEARPFRIERTYAHPFDPRLK